MYRLGVTPSSRKRDRITGCTCQPFWKGLTFAFYSPIVRAVEETGDGLARRLHCPCDSHEPAATRRNRVAGKCARIAQPEGCATKRDDSAYWRRFPAENHHGTLHRREKP